MFSGITFSHVAFNNPWRQPLAIHHMVERRHRGDTGRGRRYGEYDKLDNRVARRNAVRMRGRKVQLLGGRRRDRGLHLDTGALHKARATYLAAERLANRHLQGYGSERCKYS